jgi:hypothetical protein
MPLVARGFRTGSQSHFQRRWISRLWVVGLHGVEKDYSYNVMQLDPAAGAADIWRVRIAADFNSWEVEHIQ